MCAQSMHNRSNTWHEQFGTTLKEGLREQNKSEESSFFFFLREKKSKDYRVEYDVFWISLLVLWIVNKCKLADGASVTPYVLEKFYLLLEKKKKKSIFDQGFRNLWGSLAPARPGFFDNLAW